MKLIDLLSELEPGTMLQDNAGAPIAASDLLDELANCDPDDREYLIFPEGIYLVNEVEGYAIYPRVYSILDLSSALDLALIQRSKGTWDPEILEALAKLAGLSEEWKQADGDTVEGVIAQIEEKLDVDLR